MLKHLNSYIDFIDGVPLNTIKSYKRFINKYFNNFNYLSEENINLFINNEKSASSKNSAKVSISNYWNWLFNQEYIEKNINKNKIKKVNVIMKEAEFLEPDEIKLFMEKIFSSKMKVYIAAITMLLNTGVRISELITLENKDLNLDEKYIRIQAKNSKNRIPRKCFFNDDTKKYLIEYLDSKENKSGKIFDICGSSIAKKITKIIKKCNIDKNVTPHTLRHTFATLSIKNKTSLFVVSKSLGHKNLATTSNIYVHVIDDDLKENGNISYY